MTIESTFESLRVWHDARSLTLDIYQATKQKTFIGDRSLRDQIRRAAISVMSNIAEGCERGGAKEFLQFLRIAKGSAGEVRCQLYAAQDLGYLTVESAAALRQKALIVSGQIAALIRHRTSRDNRAD
jgi:four helix bundle protein